ncbi:MAG: bifunctional phosphoribosylaminoimidazolecarboxamide formyltransferase/IMP cyclohydrolase [Candidatus Caldatribacteriota bacterium]|nr:bifunctional phosphoribosylaminoimidazolecarboxamide formyltransferase/IMP cyclohydrolase [Atribacterota bacterium]MDD3031752.1 bifunctional phosphoribosylaminoimidazolecarboxamide formyltransferase/IMP cyclohydrolase [Atribacterota bacterium]MDD3640620.1 bifunctional phosphoribosylaminoimidazolecarboxamide formyltransferase/IMP cyclohydrolase [Atribacterota bacterium]MDD4288320.1 bifunctional phosphoribosylaminoimidazolecarboxamide formyltransferase/IMP cyclohydrolase [Atribacterota bacteriu
MEKQKRAIISVSDKTGIVKLAKGLNKAGYEIISTGGTAKKLKESGINVTLISDLTGFPEILDGRVKTLHPVIFGGLLAQSNNPEHQRQLQEQKISPIQIVIVNLYPFEKTILKEDVSLEDAIENIDIGGPSLLRASAKNYQDVTVAVDPDDYKVILEELESFDGNTSLSTREKLAVKVFQHTAYYDSLIAKYLPRKILPNESTFPEYLVLGGKKSEDLRYGENPHQKAAFYSESIVEEANLGNAQLLSGKELSFNNLVDLEAAMAIVKDFDEPTVTFIKHTNPCGLATADTIEEAYQKAYEGDPLSAYGSIIGINRRVEEKLAILIDKTPFVEAIVAPFYSQESLKILKVKKNRRLLQVGDLRIQDRYVKDIKKVSGGFLLQDRDLKNITENDLTIVSEKKPVPEELKELLLGWKIVKHVKSNAIVLSINKQLVGVGAGQMSRVDSVKIAVQKAGKLASGSYLASDAFFPFSDGIEEAGKAGIRAIIQPGGSKRDDEVIKAVNNLGMIMVFTGHRCFKH